MNLRAHRIGLAISSLAVAAVLATPMVGRVAPAAGSPIDDKRAEASRLLGQIEQNGMRISALDEKFNGARLRLEEAEKSIDRAEADLAKARAEMEAIRSRVAARAVEIYKGNGTRNPLDAVDAGDMTQMAAKSKYADTTAERDDDLLGQLQRLRRDLDRQKKQYEDAREEAKAERDAIAASRDEIERANAEQRRLLARTQGELAGLVREQQQARAAAEAREAAAAARRIAAATQAASSNASSGGGGLVVSGPVPSASGGAGAAVAYARAQIGKPYCYGGSGPSCYDCSGLTMMAWAQAGVGMPHGSLAQAAMFPRVPDNALQPGDLSVYHGGGHIGIYVGGGVTVSATQTGDFIRVQPVFRSGYMYSVRPG
ncbi:MAG: C40 family peptidase [Acidimicrobiia bacterium]|nr:C40 family peptidase [Acidimicrobiia bacterium]